MNAVFRDRVAKTYKPPKWNSTRTVPVPPRLQAEIDSYVADNGIAADGLLFPGYDGTPMEPHSILESLRAALESIGIPREEQDREKRFLDQHALRHTYVPRLSAGNVPLWEVQAAVGHKSVAVTQRYTHVGGNDL